MKEKIRSIEHESLDAWPALDQETYDGSVLRFSKGYTKRANSVNALAGSTLGLSEKVDFCELAYHSRNLPPIFRITPLSPPDLDELLDERGYRTFHPTWVMTKTMTAPILSPEMSSTLVESPLNAWIEINSALNNVPPERESIHKEIIQSIKKPCFFASILEDDAHIACGLGVLGGVYFGLFDIITHPLFRNQGFGTQLVADMVAWAIEYGASTAYLQVMENNIPARCLYKKFGFQDSYRYWYRVPNG
jgi:GNAT superfamily N-acetyltransferase